MPHISIKPEVIFDLFGFPVTNSLLLTWILLGLLALFAYFFQKEFNKKKSDFVIYTTIAVKGLYGLFESLMKEKTMLFFPLLGAFFFFILFSNWLGLLPGVGSILIKEPEVHKAVESIHHESDAVEIPHAQTINPDHTDTTESHGNKIPLLRAPTADLNTTLALAIISVFFIQYYGFKHLGPKYGTKFINLKSPIDFGLGILEIVSEFSRILSFSFRLFGNIFAGEVLLVIVASLVPVLASFPFLMLELFVGLIQALVFSMLTAVFFSSALAHEEH